MPKKKQKRQADRNQIGIVITVRDDSLLFETVDDVIEIQRIDGGDEIVIPHIPFFHYLVQTTKRLQERLDNPQDQLEEEHIAPEKVDDATYAAQLMEEAIKREKEAKK